MPFHEVYQQPHKTFVGNNPSFHIVYIYISLTPEV
ncbi:hypothetical protein ZEAMMB73_Zm00001d028518 [Zea mays]|uniref:Uncharacterized protein n=1 Tax=Zea mays TaxID=4577 RepID=A0A1D6JX18_MAIZE|nr:hypothetical protein ZEAMMB73_Zm00001d028518 [Zea mays]